MAITWFTEQAFYDLQEMVKKQDERIKVLEDKLNIPPVLFSEIPLAETPDK